MKYFFMSIETKRKRLLQKVKEHVRANNTSSHKLSRLPNAPTRNGIDNVLDGKNCTLNTLLFVLDSVGLEINFTTSKNVKK